MLQGSGLADLDLGSESEGWVFWIGDPQKHKHMKPMETVGSVSDPKPMNKRWAS